MKLKSAQSYPDQTTFQGISFCLIVSSWHKSAGEVDSEEVGTALQPHFFLTGITSAH
ncbi:hypothetical protein [Ktedonobacter robiniae]|uniref:Uncharacterized protein n=1 Tax=Ktedonobacter robiniae TaxID=2778365 RepID=A0ABQ3UYX9_9CHLR|nr:hypothetical protein [Ktedonobacter robiniae]GHO57862.1 hypothetical protein KSB_63370 [Ktedonobacter robiniae]